MDASRRRLQLECRYGTLISLVSDGHCNNLAPPAAIGWSARGCRRGEQVHFTVGNTSKGPQATNVVGHTVCSCCDSFTSCQVGLYGVLGAYMYIRMPCGRSSAKGVLNVLLHPGTCMPVQALATMSASPTEFGSLATKRLACCPTGARAYAGIRCYCRIDTRRRCTVH